MDSPETYISLYAGGGGLDLGFHRANPDAQCIAFVEHEASAAALLVDHIEAELLDAAPVFTDAFTFPAGRFHGLVDWIIGGPPCQPFSVAGKRLGADDARNLWPLTLRMVEAIQPGGCFFENVPSADSLWYVYSEVIPGLQYLGYEVEAGIFSAAEVGAPHNRERVFILGLARELADTRSEQRNSRRDTERGLPTEIGQVQGQDEQRRDRLNRVGERSSIVGNTDQPRPQGRHRPQRERGDERPAWPPGPSGNWASIPERLWPAVKPDFRDVADELAGRVAALSRSQELRILGNGVVPATAEKAFNTLRSKL